MHKYNPRVKENIFKARFFDTIPSVKEFEEVYIKEIIWDWFNTLFYFKDALDILNLQPRK